MLRLAYWVDRYSWSDNENAEASKPTSWRPTCGREREEAKIIQRTSTELEPSVWNFAMISFQRWISQLATLHTYEGCFRGASGALRGTDTTLKPPSHGVTDA